jgi:hypothetical protein
MTQSTLAKAFSVGLSKTARPQGDFITPSQAIPSFKIMSRYGSDRELPCSSIRALLNDFRCSETHVPTQQILQWTRFATEAEIAF